MIPKYKYAIRNEPDRVQMLVETNVQLTHSTPYGVEQSRKYAISTNIQSLMGLISVQYSRYI